MQTTVPLPDIQSGQSQVVSINDQRVLVCNVDGQYYAIGDVCTHDNGPLGDGALEGCRVVCPRHGATFDVRDGTPTMPAVRPVPTYTVIVDGETLIIGA
jgi:3-phenylpropionate/trans-cinnamate dioxygenase ferredoxin component